MVADSGTVTPRRISPDIRRERIGGSVLGECFFCHWIKSVGTLITWTRWILETPSVTAAFLCDDCLLDIASADQKYIDEHGLDKQIEEIP